MNVETNTEDHIIVVDFPKLLRHAAGSHKPSRRESMTADVQEEAFGFREDGWNNNTNNTSDGPLCFV